MTTLVSLLKYDVRYREFLPRIPIPSQLAPGSKGTWSEQSVAEACSVDMLESDILLLTYPKSGEAISTVLCYDFASDMSGFTQPSQQKPRLKDLGCKVNPRPVLILTVYMPILQACLLQKQKLNSVPLCLQGTTWTMSIMGLIFGAKDIEAGEELKSTHLFEKMQFIDIQYPDGTTGAQRFMKMEPPRLIKSHLNFEFYQKQMQIYPHMKIINLY